MREQLTRLLKYVAFAGVVLPLVACTSSAPFRMSDVNYSKSARSQASRAQFLILHYTALNDEKSLQVLTEQGVSSHYLVGDDQPVSVYQLVDESRIAHHAGVSSWKNHSLLNGNSIGIEIVNLGYVQTPEGKAYQAYPSHQIEALITLIKDIVARHQISPDRILGHAEIAPQRKPDPGPLFPWTKLAEAGLIVLPNADEVLAQQRVFQETLPSILWFQERLAQVGYAVPRSGVLDQETLNVIRVFQTRYRQRLYDGQPDAETAALLEVITKKK